VEVSLVAKSILIVEDERLLLKTLTDALRDEGYETSAAHNAEDAEALLFSDGSFDLVVLDNRLPDGSGVEVLRRIRDEELPVRVMVMTAYGRNGLEAELTTLGVDRFVKKPFDLASFLKDVADVVGDTAT
jgi:DNA-binding response OmpR family regulator